ncbi:MAG: hypothetical protein OXH72_15045 [Caldilineaceae bacterium]|nr:hypothetical protein [Caldilineaceae bacterium]
MLNILVLVPCGKPRAAFITYIVVLLRWLLNRVHFTNLEYYGGLSGC